MLWPNDLLDSEIIPGMPRQCVIGRCVPKRRFLDDVPLGQCVTWTICLLDNVLLGQCASWTMCYLDDLPLGQCVTLTICLLDNVLLRQCASWTMCYLDDLPLGQCVTWTMCLLDNVLLGRCASWTMCYLDNTAFGRCVPGILYSVHPHKVLSLRDTPNNFGYFQNNLFNLTPLSRGKIVQCNAVTVKGNTKRAIRVLKLRLL
jgi:hypothetical protein